MVGKRRKMVERRDIVKPKESQDQKVKFKIMIENAPLESYHNEIGWSCGEHHALLGYAVLDKVQTQG
jgi:hypothetical protein